MHRDWINKDWIECLSCGAVYPESKKPMSMVMTCPKCGNDDLEDTIYLMPPEKDLTHE